MIVKSHEIVWISLLEKLLCFVFYFIYIREFAAVKEKWCKKFPFKYLDTDLIIIHIIVETIISKWCRIGLWLCNHDRITLKLYSLKDLKNLGGLSKRNMSCRDFEFGFLWCNCVGFKIILFYSRTTVEKPCEHTPPIWHQVIWLWPHGYETLIGPDKLFYLVGESSLCNTI